MTFDVEERELVARLLGEVRRRAPLDSERERQLAKTIQAGIDASKELEAGWPVDPERRARLTALIAAGRDAKHELVIAHLPLVVGMARRFRWSPLSLLELIQEGSLALLRAAERFDWRRGTPFAAYASWWVRHAMSRSVREELGSSRLPTAERRKLRRLAEARADAPDATTTELGLAASVDRSDAEALVPLLGSPIPFSALADRTHRVEELLADREAEERLEEVLLSADAARVVSTAERLLTDRERTVLEARYGLDGRDPQTLREVAERLGISVQRVAQIERAALERLRDALAAPPR